MLELEIFAAGLIIGKWHKEIFKLIDDHFGGKKKGGEIECTRLLLSYF